MKDYRYFKLPQEDDFHYYKVCGGEEKYTEGYQEVVNFLGDKPVIMVQHNVRGQLTGTWCTYEVGIPITEEEYQAAYTRATSGDFTRWDGGSFLTENRIVDRLDFMLTHLREVIKEFRKKRGYTQGDVAERLGIGQVAYSHLENGKNKLGQEHLYALSNILDTNLYEVLFRGYEDGDYDGMGESDVSTNDSDIVNQALILQVKEYQKLIKEKDDLISLLKERANPF